MTTYTVTTTAQLLKYAGSSVSGDTILLKPGTYSAVSIANVVKPGNVTIASADLAHRAVLTDLTVKNSAGLTFSGVEFAGSRDLPFQVQSSSRIVLDKLDVHGSLNGTSHDDYRGMLIRNSNNVTVSNSHFHELTDALGHIDSRAITFSGNSFDTIRDNGIVGGGTSNITVSNNTFTNFDHVGDVHPDAIQFWTTNTTASASDITVTGNVFSRGTGSVIQGVWIKDDVGTLPYRNVTITDNAVVGGAYNGIVLTGARNATISGNVVIGAGDQPSWIGVKDVAAVTITDNEASSFNFVNSGVTSSGNVQTAVVATPRLAAGNAAKFDASSAASYFGVALLGFVDGPSTTGHTYNFAETRIDGTGGADRLSAATIGASHLYGYDGNDSLNGGKNGLVSTLEGGKGDDTYTIYQPQDVVIEQANSGYDTIYTSVDYTLGANVEALRASAGGLTLHGNDRANTLVAHAGGSVLYGEGGDDVLQGGAGNDQLFGGDGADRITSGGGNDYIEGGAGNDVLVGGAGRNVLLGGTGNDTIEGGPGVDTLTGGAGADTFVFRNGDFNASDMTGSRDVITDFKPTEGDRLSLSAIDANTRTAADDAFTFIGTQAFHGIAGELRYFADGDGITVTGDTNGDRIADLAIHLTGMTTIVASSIYL